MDRAVTDYFLGVDGGGSKTAFILTDGSGCVLARAELGGCSLPHIGEVDFIDVLRRGIERCAEAAGINVREITRSAFGMPCFGESETHDARMIFLIRELTGDPLTIILNDVEVAHAGSLALGYGVHIVDGTGAIVMGKDADGSTARANGWHDQFSDEGSGYWLGLRTLACFAKQSDRRLERGPLYELIKKYFELENDFDIVTRYDGSFAGRRDKVAKLQELLCEAAEAGDASAINLYDDAARELFLSVRGVCRALGLGQNGGVDCSYSGGVFKAGELIFGPLRRYLNEIDVRLVPPVLDPARGAALVALNGYDPARVKEFAERLAARRTN